MAWWKARDSHGAAPPTYPFPETTMAPAGFGQAGFALAGFARAGSACGCAFMARLARDGLPGLELVGALRRGLVGGW